MLVAAFRRARGREGVRGREMRLADEAGAIAGARQLAGEAVLAGLRRQVDAVVGDAMRARQQPGQDRGARRLADQIGRDAGAKAGAALRHQIEMRGLDLAPLDAEAVATLLIGGDEQDVGSLGHAIAGVPGTTLLVCQGNLPAGGGFGKLRALLRRAMVTIS